MEQKTKKKLKKKFPTGQKPLKLFCGERTEPKVFQKRFQNDDGKKLLQPDKNSSSTKVRIKYFFAICK